MMKLKQLCVATVLTVALSFNAVAGIIDTPGVMAPPPPQSDRSSTSGTTEATSSETSNNETTATNSMAKLTLYLFDSVIYSIF